jgi:hypothetical protein
MTAAAEPAYGHVMDEPHGHSLLLAFDTSDPEFGRGFEAGRLWQLLQSDAEELVEYLHASNAEMAMRMAEATGRNFQAEELDATWMEIIFTAREAHAPT